MRPHRWVDIAMVFQGAMNAFNPVQTIGDQIVEAIELHGPSRAAAPRARADGELLELGRHPRRPRRRATRTSSRAACASAPRSRWRSRATRGC